MTTGSRLPAYTVTEGAVFLRPFIEVDVTPRYLSWFRDTEVTRFLDARDISREDALDHLLRGGDGRNWRIYAICQTDGGRHIGNLKIGPINWRHMTSDLVTVLGERDVWGKGYARAAIGLGIRIAFDELNIRKLSASIDSRNTGSIKAYAAAGFHVETRLADHFMEVVDSRPVLSDKVYVACFNPSFDSSRL